MKYVVTQILGEGEDKSVINCKVKVGVKVRTTRMASLRVKARARVHTKARVRVS